MTVLTSCKTQYAPPAVEAGPALKELLPELPDLPEWPKLNWEYRDGWYCLSEADIDKVLDYWENSIPLYKYQVDLYKKELVVIISHL